VFSFLYHVKKVTAFLSFFLRWEIVTKGYDIGFGLFYKPLGQTEKLHAGEMGVEVSTVCAMDTYILEVYTVTLYMTYYIVRVLNKWWSHMLLHIRGNTYTSPCISLLKVKISICRSIDCKILYLLYTSCALINKIPGLNRSWTCLKS